MLNLGMGEVFVILLIALLIFGPNKLPEMARSIGRAIKAFQAEGQKAASVFKEALEPPKTTAGVVDRPDTAHAGAVEAPPTETGPPSERPGSPPRGPQPSRDAIGEPSPEGNGRPAAQPEPQEPAPQEPALDRDARLLEDT